MVVAEDIHKYYGDLHVLKGVSLTVYPQEIIILMGPSGAGKSTLLQIIGTLERPDAGKLFLFGKDVMAMKQNAIAKLRNQKMGFVFQFHYLLPEFTALENVMLPALIGGENEEVAKEKARQLLERLNLGHRIEHYPDQMSGGEQQRVAVARALINNPELLLADEPTGNLDIRQTRLMMDLFKQLCKEEGYSFVIVTHNPEFRKIADRLYTIIDGKILEGYHL
ncbi:MAG: ABC transporter ATP-binding protein [Chlorobi bacterium]|nr:ABC transporter ATP-binding protein [Chlorobiota bacterium]